MLRILMATAVATIIAGSALAQTGKTEGEIRKIDKENGKITLRHGPIAGELEMPGMSMVMQVKDRSLLDSLQVGDKVEAVILKQDGIFFIQEASKKAR